MFNPKRVQENLFCLLYLCLNFQHTNIFYTEHHINVCIIHKMSTRTNFCSIINFFRGSEKEKSIQKNNTKLQRNNIVEIKTLLGAKKEKRKI